MSISRYNWHPQKKRWRYAFAVIAVALGIVVWFATRSESDWLPRILIFFFVVVSLFLLIEQDVRVDGEAGVVVREGRLFGRYLVWRIRDRLSDFTGVGFRRHHDPDGGDTVFVGLRRHSGRLVAIQYFSVGAGGPCHEAEKAGRSLSEVTGLQLHDDKV
jgi:hypothetical protein